MQTQGRLSQRQKPNLFVIPSHLDLVGAEIELINAPNRENILKTN